MEKAMKALASVRGVPTKQATANPAIRLEIEGIHASVEREKMERGGWLDCFKPGNKILYRSLLGEWSSFRIHLRHLMDRVIQG